MLELQGITMAFHRNAVLRGVSLQCASGDAVCVAGENAAGKTTLLSIAAGLQKPDAGTVLCGGTIGYLPQSPLLMEDLSLKDNLRLWYAANNMARKQIFAPGTPEALLGLEPYASTSASKLSGGLKKRLSLACTLTGNPDVLLLDEPFSALDAASRALVCSLLGQLQLQKKGLLFVSHEPAAIAAVATRVLWLAEGIIARELVLTGTLQQRQVQVSALFAQAMTA